MGTNGADGPKKAVTGPNGTDGEKGAEGPNGPTAPTAPRHQRHQRDDHPALGQKGLTALPTGAAATTVVELPVPAGNYVVLAKTQLFQTGAGDSVECLLKSGTTTLDQAAMKTLPALASVPAVAAGGHHDHEVIDHAERAVQRVGGQRHGQLQQPDRDPDRIRFLKGISRNLAYANVIVTVLAFLVVGAGTAWRVDGVLAPQQRRPDS